MALQRQTISIPIAEGLDTKTDSKQVTEGKALVLENVRFQKTGKLSKRFGLVKQSIITDENDLNTYNLKAVIADNEYLATQTDKGIFGFSSAEDKWVKQTDYSGGANVTLGYIGRNTLNQRMLDQDTTTDGTFTAFCCVQYAQGLGASTKSYLLALRDNQTGLIKYLTIGSPTFFARCRVICEKLNGEVKIHFFYTDGTNLVRQIFDFSLDSGATIDVITSFPMNDTIIPNYYSQFEVIKYNSVIYLSKLSTNSASLILKSYDLSGVLQNSATAIIAPGGTSPSMSMAVVSNKLHVAYTTSSNVKVIGFNLNLTAAIAQYTLSLVVASVKDVTLCSDGNNLFVAWGEFSSPSSYYNYTSYVSLAFTSSYSPLSSTSNVYRLFPATNAFNVNGKIYCILKEYDFINGVKYVQNNSFYIANFTDGIISQVFGAASSNSYATYDWMLPKVSLVNGKLFSVINRASQNTDYTQSDLQIDFNNDYKDNSKVKVGDRLYNCDGSLIEMSKNNPHENGFVFAPTMLDVTEVAGSGGVNVRGKIFTYCAIYEYFDSEGNITRSAPSYFVTTPTIALTTSYIAIKVYSPVFSMKWNQTTGRYPQAVIYRTLNSGSVFYRIGTVEVTNDGTFSGILQDNFSDSVIATQEQIYTTGDILQNDPAPSAKFCFSGGNRIFLGGLEEKDEIAYSKKQLFGESVAFSDLFRIRVSTGTFSDKTPITAGGYMDGKVIIFRGQSIYFCQGDGPTETGTGGFSDPEIISSDVGCTDPKSVIMMPSGLMFKSRKGIYLLDRGMTVQYIGAPVEDYNSQNVVSSILSDKFNEVRFYLQSGDCLVFNYLFQTWSVFKNESLIDADIWAGSPVIVKNNAIYKETENIYLDDTFYSMKFVSPWLKLGNLQGYQRVYQLWILGDYKSPHTLKCKVYVDYDETVFETYDLIYDNSSSPQYQFQISLPVQKVESMKFEIYDDNQSGNGESFDLSGIQVEVGMKAGGYKLAANKSY
jgi:hypothetical protein